MILECRASYGYRKKAIQVSVFPGFKTVSIDSRCTAFQNFQSNLQKLPASDACKENEIKIVGHKRLVVTNEERYLALVLPLNRYELNFFLERIIRVECFSIQNLYP